MDCILSTVESHRWVSSKVFFKKVTVAIIRRMICRQQRQKGDQFGGGHAAWQEDGAETRTDSGGGMNSTSHDEVPPLPEVVGG